MYSMEGRIAMHKCWTIGPLHTQKLLLASANFKKHSQIRDYQEFNFSWILRLQKVVFDLCKFTVNSVGGCQEVKDPE